MVQLTAGSCHRLFHADPNDDELFNMQHTLQLLSVKKVSAATTGSVDRYRIIISDGISYMQAMLATQLNNMVDDNSIGKYTIITVEKLTCSLVQDNKRYAT